MRLQKVSLSYRISIHAPTGGATCYIPEFERYYFISIHAPTGGATHCDKMLILNSCISIHAPTGGATVFPVPLPPHINIFQSTLPRGERHLWYKETENHKEISIHAPTGGATFKSWL